LRRTNSCHARYGYPQNLIPIIGVLELACTAVYAVPRTAVLGAILVAAYLGGATATNVRIGDPSFIVTSFLGILAWGGLYLRDDRVRALIPHRTKSAESKHSNLTETPSQIA
jgi:DoxX-like family